MGIIRDMFPGGNTSQGFYSYYDNIIEKDANRIFVLKGGPGTGKSSLMKDVSHELFSKGFDVEHHHCSSDNNSLDGIVVPELKVAMIDGTAPHIVDPKFPGAVEEIINLGEYWNAVGIEKNRKAIIKYIEKNSKYYKRAYKYLGAAKLILEDIIWKNQESIEWGKLNLDIENIIEEIFRGMQKSNRIGKIRHLFGSAYTPNGYIDYTDTQLKNIDTVYYLKGGAGTGKTTVMTKIYNNAINRGFNVEVFHTPLIPEKILTVIIKDLKIAFTSSEKIEDKYTNIIDMNFYLDTSIDYNIDIFESEDIYNKLISIAINNIKDAKRNHDIIEQYYIPNMNFKSYGIIKKRVVDKMLSYRR